MRLSSTGIESRKKTLYDISICSSRLSTRSGENLHSNDSHRKASSLQSTGCVQARKSCESAVSLRNRVVVGVSTSERSVDKSPAASITTACRIRHIDERSAEGQVKEHSQKAEECDAAETAHQEQGEDCVKDGGTGDTFDGTDVCVDVQVVVMQCCEEVREDRKDYSGTAELDEAEDEGERLQGDTSKCHFGCRCVYLVWRVVLIVFADA
jgi:hypothetical protein